jgi:hypothetical protein
VALYNEYLSAFNEKDLEKTLSFLSPDITLGVDGRIKKLTYDETVAAYTGHWAKLTQPIIIHGEAEELDDGVLVVLDDRDAGRRFKIRYHFREEEGKWFHIHHEAAKGIDIPKVDAAD